MKSIFDYFLLFQDAVMPVMNGKEFRLAQLGNASFRDVPVIIYSSEATAPEIARELKCEGVSTKGHRDLLKEVKRVLETK
jgi:CheY-like chemotaxis protein